MTPEQLKADAEESIDLNWGFMTLTRPKGVKFPPGFPRGELLCETFAGNRAYSFDAHKILAWVKSFEEKGAGE